ncbi:hypothetical protein QUA82_30280 [Microcoleus sp. F8-D3]
MLANTHKAICLDKRDWKKLKNDKIRDRIKFTILQMANVGHRKKTGFLVGNPFWVCQGTNRAETRFLTSSVPVIVSIR